MRRDDEDRARRIDEPLARLWDALPTPSDEELHEVAGAASREPRSALTARTTGFGSAARRLRLGWVAAVGVALLVGSALGFGVAGSATPSGSAGGNFVGFGFLPAQGWNVMQSGTLDSTGVARAIAANVPLDARDDLAGPPQATLVRLPARGLLVLAIFRPRGDPEEDFKFPARETPLRLGDALTTSEAGKRAQYRLRAGVRGYNIDVRVHFGSARPSARSLATAQRQLDRLVVAADRVTMFAQPSVVSNPRNRSVRLFGSIDSDRDGESIAIQAKDCGSNVFRLVAGATSESGGAWSTLYWPAANTTVRAVWDDVASPQIAIRVRVFVGLYKKRDGKSLRIVASGTDNFWRKRVDIQRFVQRLGTWRRLRTVVLTDSGSSPGSGPKTGRSGSLADFVPRVPRGTLLRAVMPLSQAKPCYLAGTSAALRW